MVILTKLSPLLLLWHTTLASKVVASSQPDFSVIRSLQPKRIIPNNKNLNNNNSNNNNNDNSNSNNNDNTNKRKLDQDDNPESYDDLITTLNCDIQFLSCLTHPQCSSCFAQMESEDIDWSFVAPDTPCTTVVNVLAEKSNICTGLTQNTDEMDMFCNTFDKCVIYDDIGDDDDDVGDDDGWDDEDGGEFLDCDKLESCEFEGFKSQYIGDGICHEFIRGCYNHAICGYDGGDCCKDTCQNKTEYAGCGSDGYSCRDPQSELCMTQKCQDTKNDSGSSTDDGKNKPTPKEQANCTSDETVYRLLQFDTFGDGWDYSMTMNVTKQGRSNNDDTNMIYQGKLHQGSEGVEYICLSNQPSCYDVKLHGGSWGNDISWQIKTMAKGSGEVASGGAPMECNFPIAGGNCENTCLGRPNLDTKKDPQYQAYHELSDCIDKKCVIQQSICSDDHSCIPCMTDVPPAYCIANTNYTALVFCTQCNCVNGFEESDRIEFCSAKSRGKAKEDDDKKNSDSKDGDGSDGTGNKDKATACDSEQRKLGLEALSLYSECSNIEDTSMMTLFEFDSDHFGLLDSFESCASEYLQNPLKNSAMACMKILEDAINNPAGTVNHDTTQNIPTEAIKVMANDLLHNGHDFCDCSSRATEKCPACQDFIRFKTLLYESLDACNALDEIDCGAWQEYYLPCKANIEDTYGQVNFNDNKQCDFVMKSRCGNVGPFPSFRRLDCGTEISEAAWNFYLDYSSKCLKMAPTPKVQPAPTPKVPVPVPAPTPKKYVPPSDSNNTPGIPVIHPTAPAPVPVPPTFKPPTPKKYVPPEARGGHHFRNFVLVCIFGGISYWFYKKRSDFDYSQFRMARTRNFQPFGGSSFSGDGSFSGTGDDSGMFASLTMVDQSGGTSFQPPSLPPPPTAYYSNNGGGLA